MPAGCSGQRHAAGDADVSCCQLAFMGAAGTSVMSCTVLAMRGREEKLGDCSCPHTRIDNSIVIYLALPICLLLCFSSPPYKGGRQMCFQPRQGHGQSRTPPTRRTWCWACQGEGTGGSAPGGEGREGKVTRGTQNPHHRQKDAGSQISGDHSWSILGTQPTSSV